MPCSVVSIVWGSMKRIAHENLRGRTLEHVMVKEFLTYWIKDRRKSTHLTHCLKSFEICWCFFEEEEAERQSSSSVLLCIPFGNLNMEHFEMSFRMAKLIAITNLFPPFRIDAGFILQVTASKYNRLCPNKQ